MRRITGFGTACCLLLFSFSIPVWAQSAAAVIAGAIVDASSKPVAGARITITATAQATRSVVSDTAGKYAVSGLAPGTYNVTVSSPGFAEKTASTSVTASAQQIQDFVLTELPSAPGSPSLGDLGFTSEQTKANPQLQARLARRTEMLKIHQRLGILTTIPMAAAVITGPMAKAKGKNGATIKEPTQANLDTHIALGGATTALYLSTAYFAIRAPRIEGTEKHGAIRWHEALAWIHGPGMILTPALGIMAYKQENAGEKVHGIAAAHGAVAYVTAASYGAAIVAVSWPIHIKFWEKR